MTHDTNTTLPPMDAAMLRRLLACGVVAGPLFIGVVVIQMLTRTGFDTKHHPLSLLSVGDGGWVQIVNFVVAGILVVACAVGIRRVLGGSRAGTSGPSLIGLAGLFFIWGGVFVSDPSLGFPPGTPDVIPDQQSWHSALHQVAPVVVFATLSLGCLVFARRFIGLKQRGWATFSAVTPIAAFALSGMATGGEEYDFRFLLAGLAVLMGWLSLIAWKLMRQGTGMASR